MRKLSFFATLALAAYCSSFMNLSGTIPASYAQAGSSGGSSGGEPNCVVTGTFLYFAPNCHIEVFKDDSLILSRDYTLASVQACVQKLTMAKNRAINAFDCIDGGNGSGGGSGSTSGGDPNNAGRPSNR